MGVASPSLAILAETQTLEAQLVPGLISCLVLLSLLAQSEEEGAAFFFSARQLSEETMTTKVSWMVGRKNGETAGPHFFTACMREEWQRRAGVSVMEDPPQLLG